ncbi:DNA invertase Pin-like site-specific DNA recombinase [Paraburkholderia sp. GAS42]
MPKNKRVALYARVSTDSQTTDNQLLELRTAAERHGWEIVAEYVDHAVSGAKGRDKRPDFDRMLKSANRREFDLIAAWSVDRLGRSLINLIDFMEEIRAKGVGLYLHQQNIDTTTPAGRAMFQMCGVFAEFERAMVQERVHAGLDRARAQGKTFGRPRIAGPREEQILALAATGLGMLKIAKQVGVGTGTVQRIIAEQKAATTAG